MSEFSKVLDKYVKKRKIQIPELARYCNLECKEIFRILNGKDWLPEEETVNKIMLYMKLTPFEKQDMVRAYEISLTGKEKYYMRKQVQNLIEYFPEYFYSDGGESILEISTSVQEKENRDCIPLFNQTEINQCIHYICIREARRQKKSKIQLMMQPDCKFVMGLLQNLNSINENLEIEHVFCVDNAEQMSENMEFYNLSYLRNVLQFYINAVKYHVYGIDEDLQLYGEGLPGFSNLLLTEEYALVCTADFGRGMLYKDSKIKIYFRERYEEFRSRSRKLFHVVDNVQNQMRSLGDMGWDRRLSYAIQPEPCLLSLVTPELLNNIVRIGLPEREMLLPYFQNYIAGAYARIQKGINFFYCTKEGLNLFAREGKFAEVPDEIYRPLVPEERIQLIEAALPLCQKGYFRLLKRPLDQLSANLHLCMNEQEGYLLFRNINGQNIYLIFHDRKLLWAFWDFLDSLDDRQLYTGEETAEYFKNVITDLRKQLLYKEEKL